MAILIWIKDKLEDVVVSLILCLVDEGHDFHKAIVTQQMDQFQIRSQIEDMEIVFPQVPFGLL